MAMRPVIKKQDLKEKCNALGETWLRCSSSFGGEGENAGAGNGVVPRLVFFQGWLMNFENKKKM